MSPRAFAFGVLCLVQLGVAAGGIARYERVLSAGQQVSLIVAPVDPYDPFRGRYVTLSFLLERDVHPLKGRTLEYNEPAYVVLKVDGKGVATVDHVTATKPAAGLWLKADSAWPESDTTVRVSLPMKRYYMNEQLAPAAEAAYRDAMANADDVGGRSRARVRILDGAVVIEQVLLDGIPIERAARDRKN